MDIVVWETDRLNVLITDFLQYSRPTPLTPKPIAVRGLLGVIATLLEVGELTIGVDRVLGDPSQEGAGTGRRGVDRLGTRRPPPEACEWIEIAISDEGTGIPADVQERIFEPFFTTKRQGTGLGLATVHRSVESHGGSLLVASQEGEGTTFRVRLAGSELTE